MATLKVPTPEKIRKRHAVISPRFVKWWKRYTAKRNRQAGKRLLDDMPRKNYYKGWTD